MRPSKQVTPSLILTYAILIFGAVIVIYPFAFMVANSFKTGREIMHSPKQLLPSEPTVRGYEGVFDKLDVLRLFRNTLIVAVSVTLENIILGALAGYAFAKIPFPGRNRIFSFMLLTMMIPGVLFLIPTYVLMYRIGWVGRFEALIIPGAVSVFNIFLIRQFIDGIPDELVEAARIDGARETAIFMRVILPLLRPALGTVAILTFMGSWNDFMGPLLYLNRPDHYTLQLGLLQFRGTVPGENAEQIWALTTLITIPILVLYFFIQEQFVKAFANVSLSK
jgi:multiple sugar transport system permease protein